MLRLLLATTVAYSVLCTTGRAANPDKHVLELRTYTLTDAEAEKTLDAYLEGALIPALKRQGLGPIGAFAQAEPDPTAPPQVLLLIAGDSADAVVAAELELASDEAYQSAAKQYLTTPADKPVISRISSELLLSFDVWPKATASKQKQEGRDRLFELRTYESPTERLGHLKVEMFNSGEVPIFLDSGITPVFMGQALVGDKLPNLTYMTVYDDVDSRDKAWKTFVEHADWQVLKEVKKYAGTVSKIHKSDWRPKSYSDL